MSFNNKKIIEQIQKGGEAGKLGLRMGSRTKHKDIYSIVPEMTISRSQTITLLVNEKEKKLNGRLKKA